MPVAAGVTSGFPSFQILVNDTNPIWGYCGQTNHCQSGMVFSINAPTSGSNTFDAFQSLAKMNNGTASGSATGSTDHQIIVGPNGQLIYSPENITAMPGDTVTFSFRQKNHTGAIVLVFVFWVIELTSS